MRQVCKTKILLCSALTVTCMLPHSSRGGAGQVVKAGDVIRLKTHDPRAIKKIREGWVCYLAGFDRASDLRENQRIQGDRIDYDLPASLPSGSRITYVLHGTRVKVLETLKADGQKTYEDAMRVVVLEGEHAGKTLWTLAPDPGEADDKSPEAHAESLVKQAKSLERLRKTDGARRYYHEVVAKYPKTPAALTAQQRLRVLEPAAAPSTPPRSDSRTKPPASRSEPGKESPSEERPSGTPHP